MKLNASNRVVLGLGLLDSWRINIFDGCGWAGTAPDMVRNLRILLDLQLLLEEQMAVVARRPLYNCELCISYPHSCTPFS